MDPDGMSAQERSPSGRGSPRHVLSVLYAAPMNHHSLSEWLDDVELDRLSRLRRSDDRDRFATSRALLKTLVAQLGGVEVGDIRLGYPCFRCPRAHGRPVVVGPAGAAHLHVSLSHAAERVVVAGTTAGPVGVDVEAAEAGSFPGFADVALTAAEAAWVDRIPAERRDRARTTYWVRKESVLKATGYGMSLPPTAVEVTAPDRPAGLAAWHSACASPRSVHVSDLDVGGHQIASVAVIAEHAPILRVRSAVRADLAV